MWSYLLAGFVGPFLFTIYAGGGAGNLAKEFPWQFRLAASMRTPILMFIVIPMSFALNCYKMLREVLFRSRSTASLGLVEQKRLHLQRVAPILGTVKRWNEVGRPRRIRTARPNWQCMSLKLGNTKDDCHKVKTTHLSHILNVDYDRKTITVEPSCTMGEIMARLIPNNHALEVQVEMEAITIGGVANGFGMETNCHVSGLFQETVEAYELILASGELTTVTLDSDPELFRAIPWSQGTLGILTSITVRIVRVKPFVKMEYIPTSSREELQAKMTALSTGPQPPHFLEATIYAKDKAVIQCGNFADATTPEDKKRINHINYWFKPFYYKWVESFLPGGSNNKGAKNSNDKFIEFIPLRHYYGRFTRSIFWEIEDMIPFSNHPLYRCLWGWMGAPEVSLLKLFQGPVIRKASTYAHVVQESIMPIQHLSEGIERFDGWFGVYPLLVFPLRIYDHGSMTGMLNPRKKNLVEGKEWGIWVDLGAYGAPRPVKEGKMWDAKKMCREMEHWTTQIGGFEATYCDLFCTPKEFRTMFDHTLLDKCRARLGAEDAFPEPYDKIKPEPGIVDISAELAQGL